MMAEKKIDIRFEEAPKHAYDLMKGCIKKHFPPLGQAEILILMDLKERKSQGAIVLARILKTNDLTRHLTIDDSGCDLGYDYIIFLDKLLWDITKDIDRIRSIRHELCHTDIDSDTSAYKIRPHTIEDFYSEVKRNKDDPEWRRRVADKLIMKYEEKKTGQRSLGL